MNRTTNRVDTAEIIINELMITVTNEIIEYLFVADLEAFDVRISDVTPNTSPSPLIAATERDFITQDIPVNETAMEINVMINVVMESIFPAFDPLPEMVSPSVRHWPA